MRIQRCKGTRDLTPRDMEKFRFIEGIFRESCIRWGYEEVKTPTIEYLHLFTSTGTLTPGRLGRVYSFLDWDGWSGERVVLRPDGTIPIARLYIDTAAGNEPAKFFYVTSVFAFEETGKETREKWQCGVELIGAASPVADAELITLALDVLKKTGVKNPQLRLSHAGLIRSLLEKFGLSPEEQAKTFDDILDGDEKVLAKLKAEKPELSRVLTPLLDQKGKSSGFLKNVKALFNHELAELAPALDNFIGVVEMLEELDIKYRIDIASGRGFEYYTGVTWQIIAGGEHVGGGGRYDALIPLMGGENIPASGFALYLDRLMEKVKPESETPAARVKVLVKINEKANLKESFSLVSSLHEAGYIAESDLGCREPDDFAWVVEVIDREPLYRITDAATGKLTEAAAIPGVLDILNSRN